MAEGVPASAHVDGDSTCIRVGGIDPALLVSVRTAPLQLNLRGDIDDPRFVDAVRRALHCEPPREPNTVRWAEATQRRCRLLWLGPDEWLVVSSPANDHSPLLRLEENLASLHHSLCDVSQARAVISVCGPLALEVLAKGSSLDLRPGRFALDCCAQSTLARAQMLLHRLPHDPTCPCWRDDDIARPRHFEIYVARSYLRYVLRWLDDASFEYRAASMP